MKIPKTKERLRLVIMAMLITENPIEPRLKEQYPDECREFPFEVKRHLTAELGKLLTLDSFTTEFKQVIEASRSQYRLTLEELQLAVASVLIEGKSTRVAHSRGDLPNSYTFRATSQRVHCTLVHQTKGYWEIAFQQLPS